MMLCNSMPAVGLAADNQKTAPGSADDKVYYFVGDDAFPPYSLEKKGENEGSDIDVLQEMAARAGILIKIELVPWKRAIEMARGGYCDAAFSLFYSKERAQFVDFITSQPIHKSTFRLFVKKGKEFNFTRIEDIYGKRIGMNTGFFISESFASAASSNRIILEEVEGIMMNIMKLDADRLDAFVENDIVTYYHLAEIRDSRPEIVSLPVPVVEKRGAYLALSKAAQLKNRGGLIVKIGDALTAMQKDGTFARIIKKYHLDHPDVIRESE